MKAMLHNQALAIDAFQHKWQMAGSETQAFIQRNRSHSENFVRCEMTALERFESRWQQEHQCRIRDRVLALQDECRDHVGNEEMKLRAKLQQALHCKTCSKHRMWYCWYLEGWALPQFPSTPPLGWKNEDNRIGAAEYQNGHRHFGSRQKPWTRKSSQWLLYLKQTVVTCKRKKIHCSTTCHFLLCLLGLVGGILRLRHLSSCARRESGEQLDPT